MNRQASESGRPGNAETGSEPDRTTATVEVYHVMSDAPKGVAFFEHPDSWEERREHYHHAATVEVPFGKESRIGQVLEQAWARLQNGVEAGQSARVESHVANRRSTSVGDVMVISKSTGGQSEGDASPYEVGTIGFREIEDRNPNASAGGGEPLPIGELSSEKG